MRLTGVITALVTPFKDHAVDLEGLRKNIQFQIASGVQGVLVLGTTGESPVLNEKEKEQVIRAASQETKGRVHLMVGCGSNCTRTTLEQIKQVTDLGADSAMIVCPYYNCPTQEGLFRHYSYLAEKGKFPICIYNVPKRTGSNLEPKTLLRLSEYPEIIAIKEASGNLSQIGEMLSQEKVSLLSGDDALTFPVMALGGDGVISVVSNLVPKELVDLYQACHNQNFNEARALHFRLLPLFRWCFLETNPIPIKYAMGTCGMAAGSCRLPLHELSQMHRESFAKVWPIHG